MLQASSTHFLFGLLLSSCEPSCLPSDSAPGTGPGEHLLAEGLLALGEVRGAQGSGLSEESLEQLTHGGLCSEKVCWHEKSQQWIPKIIM